MCYGARSEAVATDIAPAISAMKTRGGNLQANLSGPLNVLFGRLDDLVGKRALALASTLQVSRYC